MDDDPTEVILIVTDGEPVTWTVEASNTDSDGGVDQTTFSGPAVERRAREYAAWKYGVLDPKVLTGTMREAPCPTS